MNALKTLSVLTLASVMAYGCGSDSGGGGVISPNGIYSGTFTDGDPSRSGIEQKGIIYDGRLMLLSIQVDGIQQLFDSVLTITNTSITGSGKRYDGITLLNTVDFSGTFVTGQSSTIGFVATSNANSLPSGTMNLTTMAATYAKDADVNKLAGTWSGGFGAGYFGQMNLNFDASGVITSGIDQKSQNCQFTGSLTAASSTVNVYNANITSLGGSQCTTMDAGDYTGLAWTEGDTDGTLVLMVSNGADSRAVVLTRN